MGLPFIFQSLESTGLGMPSVRLSIRISFLLIIIICLALYGETVFFDYVWDDSLLFLDKASLVNDPLSWHLLTEPVLPGTTYMRPLVFLTWFWEFNLFGQSPVLSHSVNLCIFIVNVLLIFSICQELAFIKGYQHSIELAFLAAIIYTVHPAVIEALAWVSGRFDLMATLFMLWAVRLYLAEFKSHTLKIAVIALLMMGGLLSKELGIVLPGVLLCIWMACYADQSRPFHQMVKQAILKNGYLLVASGVVFIIYFYLRTDRMGQVYHSTVSFSSAIDALFHNFLTIESIKFYFWKAILPFYDINPIHLRTDVDPHAWYSLLSDGVFLCLLLPLLLWNCYKYSLSAWLLLAGFFCIAPVLHLIPLSIGLNLGHERFMTAPLAFWIMAIVLIRYDRLCTGQFVSQRLYRYLWSLIISIWLLMATVTTIGTLPFWSSDLQLWNLAYRKNPDYLYVRYNYLYGALKAGRADLIEKEITKIQEESTKGLEVADQLIYSNVLIRKGDPEGLKYLEGVLYALPKFHELPNGKALLGSFYYLSSVQISSAYVDYANALLVFKGDVEAALKYNEAAGFYLKESEKIPLAYQRVGLLYAAGKFSEADSLLAVQRKLSFYRKDNLELSVSQLLAGFCNKVSLADARCSALVARGLIKPEHQ